MPGAFTATLAYDAVAMHFAATWNDSSAVDHYRVSLKRTSSTDFQTLDGNLSAFTRGFTFAVGLTVQWDAAVLRVEACNASGCTAAPDVPLLPHRAEALAQKDYRKSALARNGDLFGTSIATSADGNTLAISAPAEDANGAALDTGAVYVYTRAGTTWSLQSKLTALNMEAEDLFGVSIALSGDGNTLAVGAPFEGGDRTSTVQAPNDNAPAAGAVYVFTRNGIGEWDRQHAYLKASNAEGGPPTARQNGDHFGLRVALSADGTTIVIGAIGEDGDANSTIIAANNNTDATNNFAPDAGAAYVFTRSGTNTWTQRAYLKASNAEAIDDFSEALAISADGSTIAVGAFQEDGDSTSTGDPNMDNDNAVNSGAAYVFVRNGDTWQQQQYLKSPHNAHLIQFGSSLALTSSGDTLAVGAPDEDSHDAVGSSGVVHLFDRVNGHWAPETDLEASDRFIGDHFGQAVSFAANGQTIAIGAPGDTLAQGTVYVFVRGAATWSQQAELMATHPSNGDQLGFHLALSGDGHSVFAGASEEAGDAQSTEANPNDNAPEAGAVYEF
jgi:hypothetical protein